MFKIGDTVAVGDAKVQVVEKLGDRAKFKSAKDIEVRFADLPATEEAQTEFCNKVVAWANLYFKKVSDAKSAGQAVNPRQLKKDAFAEVFGEVEAAKPKAYVRTVKPATTSAPITKQDLSPKFDPKELAARFDTFKADDMPDSGTKQADLPPLMEDEDDLLGQAHVVSEDVLSQLGGAVPNLDNLGDGSGIFD